MDKTISKRHGVAVKSKLLVENWRKFLNESTVDRIYDLIHTLKMNSENNSNECFITISDFGTNINLEYYGFDDIKGELDCNLIDTGKDVKVTKHNRKIWQVSFSRVSNPWGPLLYEVCLEYVSVIKKDSLMSDRDQVSLSAESVWSKYMDRSKIEKNVEYSQMDFEKTKSSGFLEKYFSLNKKENTPLSVTSAKGQYFLNYNNDSVEIDKLTPDNKFDDINQYSTFLNLVKKGHNIKDIVGDKNNLGLWIDSPLSKAYYKKELDVIKKLKDLNLILVYK